MTVCIAEVIAVVLADEEKVSILTSLIGISAVLRNTKETNVRMLTAPTVIKI